MTTRPDHYFENPDRFGPGIGYYVGECLSGDVITLADHSKFVASMGIPCPRCHTRVYPARPEVMALLRLCGSRVALAFATENPIGGSR